MRRTRRYGGIDATVMGVLVVLAVANLMDVYGSLIVWSAATLPATVLGCLFATLAVSSGVATQTASLRLSWLSRWPLTAVASLVAVCVAQCIVGPWISSAIASPSTSSSVSPRSPLALVDALAQGWRMGAESFALVTTIEPPVAAVPSAPLAAWTLALWASFLATGLALVLDGHGLVRVVALLPVVAAFVLAALLGTRQGWCRPETGALAALTALVWLSWRCGMCISGQRRCACTLLVLALIVGCISGRAVEPARLVLRDHVEPEPLHSDFVSPLSGMRALSTRHRDDVVLTAQGLPAGTPIRLAVMDRFDGNVWNLDDGSADHSSSAFRASSGHLASSRRGQRFKASFTLGAGLDGVWLPLAGIPEIIELNDATGLHVNTDTGTALLPTGAPDLRYQETGVIPEAASDEDIGAADASVLDQPRVEHVPSAVGELATAIAGGRSGGKAAMAMASWLRDNGWFSRGGSDEYPSLPGHGNHRLTQLLDGDAMVGDSEQYASAMALMAREIGLPSRVVLGLLPKGEDGAIDPARTTGQGAQARTEFTGRDVEAWVEIRLEGLGWVMFRPTPAETRTPQDEFDLTPPDPRAIMSQPRPPLTDPLREEPSPPAASTRPGDEADQSEHNTQRSFSIRPLAMTALWTSPIWLPVLLCSLLLAFDAVRLKRARRQGDASHRALAAWNAMGVLATRHPSARRHEAKPATRRELAQRWAAMLGLSSSNHNRLERLAEQADHAAFAGVSVAETEARTCWRLSDDLRQAILASQRLTIRWRMRLNPAGSYAHAYAHSTPESRKPRFRNRIAHTLRVRNLRVRNPRVRESRTHKPCAHKSRARPPPTQKAGTPQGSGLCLDIGCRLHAISNQRVRRDQSMSPPRSV